MFKGILCLPQQLSLSSNSGNFVSPSFQMLNSLVPKYLPELQCGILCHLALIGSLKVPDEDVFRTF